MVLPDAGSPVKAKIVPWSKVRAGDVILLRDELLTIEEITREGPMLVIWYRRNGRKRYILRRPEDLASVRK